LNRSIKHRNLDTAVSTILNQYDEDKRWSLYLASVANPFTEQQTFNEFLEKSKAPKAVTSKKIEPGLNEQQMKKQLDGANKILSGFVPPMKGGG
jgi:hypothetical protein